MDYAHDATDEIIKNLEKQLAKYYKTAGVKAKSILKKYFAKYKQADAEKAHALEKGKITKSEYIAWRIANLEKIKTLNYTTKRITDLVVKAQIESAELIADNLLDVYSVNHNWEAFRVETIMNGGLSKVNDEAKARLNYSFMIYDKKAAKKALKSSDVLIPKLKTAKAAKWVEEKTRNIIHQGITSGASIPKIVKSLENVTEMTYRQSVITARTACTSAQNAGRQQCYNEASDMGIKMFKEWMATMDGGARPAHAEANGQVVKYDDTFVVWGEDMEYPGDPAGSAKNTYNCRCTMVAQVEGSEKYDSVLNGKNFEEWRNE